MLTNALANAWYVGAWASEVRERPLGRTLLGEAVLLMRLRDGTVAAIGNRCPHRFAPLDRGQIVDDAIQCPYHGLRFDRTGACVHRPGASTGLAAASVRSFPVIERHRALWVWMGDPALADPRQIPALTELDDATRVLCGDNLLHSAADYLLTIDNLMDLSHVEFVHGSSLGSPGMSSGTVRITESSRQIQANRWMPGIQSPPAFQATMGFSGLVDHWLDMAWLAPTSLRLTVGMCAPGAQRETGKEAISFHLLTPETLSSCHYFWANSSPSGSGADIEQQRQRIRHAFEQEDKPLIEACQRMMGGEDFWSLKPVLLSSDGGGVLVRRALERLIAAQHATPPR